MRGRLPAIKRGFLLGLFLLTGTSSGLSQTNPQLRSLLNRLTGVWEGDVTVHSLDGRELGTFAMRRSFAWSGDVLEWDSTLSLPSGEHTTRGRYFVRLGRLYATVSRPGQPAQDYTGEPSQGGIYWVSALRDNRDVSEVVVSSAEGQVLELDSYEVLGLETIPGVIRIQALLHEERGESADADAARTVRTGTEWLGPSDPIDLLRSYAPPAEAPAESEP